MYCIVYVLCALVQYKKEATEQGLDMLRMPPVMKPCEVGGAAKSHVLATDDISMWDKTGGTYVFTDITYGLRRRVGYLLTELKPITCCLEIGTKNWCRKTVAGFCLH